MHLEAVRTCAGTFGSRVTARFLKQSLLGSRLDQRLGSSWIVGFQVLTGVGSLRIDCRTCRGRQCQREGGGTLHLIQGSMSSM
eukprot:1745016-Amphidinium_carterae.1